MTKEPFDERFAVTMFGYTNELLAARRTPIELLADLLATELTKNFEIDGPQHFRNFPQVSAAEVKQVTDLLAETGATVTLVGGYADRALGSRIVHSAQVVESLRQQLRLVASLGAYGLRVQADAIRVDEVAVLSAEAEALGVTILLEMQGSMTPDAPVVQSALDVIAAAATPRVRLMFDSSLFMTRFPTPFRAALRGIGLSDEVIDGLQTDWKSKPLGQFRGDLISAVQTGQLTPAIQGFFPTFFSRFGHGVPEDWKGLLPLVDSVQFKFWELADPDGGTLENTRALMQQLEATGYRGYYCSEWGGHEWYSIDQVPAASAIAWHRDLAAAAFT